MSRRKDLQHYYHVLGLRVGATETEIREAYKVLAKKYHPDRNQGDEHAMERFLEIQRARDMLIGRKTESRAITKAEELALEKALEIKRSKKARIGGKILIGVIVLVVSMAVTSFLLWAASLGRLEVEANTAILAERHDQAIAKLEKAIAAAGKKKSPEKKYQLVRTLAAVHARAGRYEKARDLLQSQSLETQDAETESLLGDVWFRLGDLRRASQAHDTAVKLAGADSPEAARRAAFLLRAGQVKAANTELARLAKLDTAEGKWAAVVLAIRANDPERALKVAAHATFVDTANAAAAHILLHQYDEAEKLYATAHATSGVSAIAGKHFGTLMAVPQSGSKRPQFVPLLGIEHQRAAVVAGLAEARLASGNYPMAIVAFQNAVELEPGLAPLQTRLAEAYLVKGSAETNPNDYKAAEFRVRQAQDADPSYTPAMTTMAMVHVAMGDEEGALKWALKAQRAEPHNAGILMTIARIHGTFGDTGREIQTYRQALRLDPHNDEARAALGEALVMGGHYKPGLVELQRAAKNPAFAEDAWKVIAYEAYDRNDFRTAEHALQQLIRMNPRDPELYFGLARCQAYLRDDRGAWESLRQAHRNGFTQMSRLEAEPAFERLRQKYGDLGTALIQASP